MEEINQLLQQYTRAFDSLDDQQIAACYTHPCLISEGDGQLRFTSQNRLQQKFSGNCESLQAQGYKSSGFAINSYRVLDDDTVLVDVRWETFLASSQLVYNTLYLCRKVDQQWRIFVARVYPCES